MGEWGGERPGGAPSSGGVVCVETGGGVGSEGPVGGEKRGPAPIPPHPRAGGIAWAGLGGWGGAYWPEVPPRVLYGTPKVGYTLTSSTQTSQKRSLGTTPLS